MSGPVPKVDIFIENTKNSYLLKQTADFNGFDLEKKLKSFMVNQAKLTLVGYIKVPRWNWATLMRETFI
jgi:hypothetical protein